MRSHINSDAPPLLLVHGGPMLSIQEIRDIHELELLEPEWNNVLKKSSRPEIFLTYEWLTTWWKCLGKKGRELFVLVVRHGDRIIGIAPFMEVRDTFFGLPIRKIEFISMMKYGDSPSNCSGSLDMIIAEQHNEVISMVMSYLAHHDKRWNLIRLNPIPHNSQTLSLLKEKAQSHGYTFRQDTIYDNCVIHVKTDWQGYVDQLSHEFRKNLKRQDRRLQDEGLICYKKLRTSDEIENIFPEILRIEKQSWKWGVGISINSAAFEDFYHLFAQQASKKGWLFLWMLQLDGKNIAYDYITEFEGNLDVLKGSYSALYARFSPGNLLTWKEIEQSFQNGTKRIGLFWGDSAYKLRWNIDREPHFEIFIFSRGTYAKFLQMLFFGLSLYRYNRLLTEWKNRIARKLGIRLRNSELTRVDQLS